MRAYIPSADVDHRTEFFSSEAFTYDSKRDVYVCPAGKELHLFAAHSTKRSLRYRAYTRDCNHCALKTQCTTGTLGRSHCRSVDEEVLERVRGYQATEPYKKALRKRDCLGGTVICGRQGLAWYAPFSLTALVAGEL